MAFAFTVEDGTGLAGANAYVSLSEADDHHAGRAHAGWSSADLASKQAAIVKATDHIELVYGERFIGQRASEAQGLSWPRELAYDRDGNLLEGVPLPVRQACAEFAARALTAPLIPDGTAEVTSESHSAGGLSLSLTYARPSAFQRWPAADRLIRALLRPMQAVRA